MPLPTVNLDDRRFQDLVDEAKRRIPTYCPEWTDHNVSDPGVALVELFAWMTELLLYRVNQVPDKVYVKFLELLGTRLAPPRAALAPVTFYLSAPQPNVVRIPAETEVATVRTETAPATVFTTEEAADVRPAALAGALTVAPPDGSGRGWAWYEADGLRARRRESVDVFGRVPTPGEAFYLGFASDLSRHVLALALECEVAGGAGVNPDAPPLAWEGWQGVRDRWARCDVERDTTRGLNEAGELVLHLPPLELATFAGREAYWVRCRLLAPRPRDDRGRPIAGSSAADFARDDSGRYDVSPELYALRAESRGVTADARHAATARDEVLGYSDGTPGQRFRLRNTPVLARGAADRVVVQPPGGAAEAWAEVLDFADSNEESPHYTLDPLDGTVTLGPALLQPDGRAYRFGRVPPHGSVLRCARYQYGGGAAGNVAAEALCVLKAAVPYVARVTNRRPAHGGRDAQTLDDAKLRAPKVLRTRMRAVTAEDFETLTAGVPGVARVRCIAPGAQPAAAPPRESGERAGDPRAGEPRPGEVRVVVLPETADPDTLDVSELNVLPADLRAAIYEQVGKRQLAGITLDVRPPRMVEVVVRARLRLRRDADPALAVALGADASAVPGGDGAGPGATDEALDAYVARQAAGALARYLNPYVGGGDGAGWPFGRDLYTPELYALLQRVPFVEYVEQLEVLSRTPAGSDAPARPVQGRLVVPESGLLCSGAHAIEVVGAAAGVAAGAAA